MPQLNVKQWTIGLLAVLGIVTGFEVGYDAVIGQVLVALLVSVVVNGIYDYAQSGKIQISESALISGFIIAMVLAPRAPLFLTAGISAVSIISKKIFVVSQRTLFNPAVFGLFLAVLFFQMPLGWWGDNYHALTIITGSVLLAKYVGHWKMVFAFFITLFLLVAARAFLLNLAIFDQLDITLGISFFFVFFMLTDPKTSPVMPDQMMTFGIITAIGSFLSILFFPSTTFLAGLLLANFVTPFLNTLSLNKIKRKAVSG